MCARVDTKPEADVGHIPVLLFTLCAEAVSLPLNPVLTLSASQSAHCKLQMGCHMLQALTWALGDLNSVLMLFVVSFLPPPPTPSHFPSVAQTLVDLN